MKGDYPAGLLAIGRFGAAHGIEGWIRLISFTDPPGNILDYHKVKILDGRQLRDVEIDDSKPHGKGFVAHISGCDERDMTRNYTGREVLVEKSVLPTLEPGNYYWHQLQGLRVINRQEDDLGVVASLLETGGNDVLVVGPAPGSIDDRERLIPYLKDRVIESVDLDTGILRVDWEADF